MTDHEAASSPRSAVALQITRIVTRGLRIAKNSAFEGEGPVLSMAGQMLEPSVRSGHMTVVTDRDGSNRLLGNLFGEAPVLLGYTLEGVSFTRRQYETFEPAQDESAVQFTDTDGVSLHVNSPERNELTVYTDVIRHKEFDNSDGMARLCGEATIDHYVTLAAEEHPDKPSDTIGLFYAGTDYAILQARLAILANSIV